MFLYNDDDSLGRTERNSAERTFAVSSNFVAAVYLQLPRYIPRP